MEFSTRRRAMRANALAIYKAADKAHEAAKESERAAHRAVVAARKADDGEYASALAAWHKAEEEELAARRARNAAEFAYADLIHRGA